MAFRANAGNIDLEPKIGGWMTGFASRLGPAQGIHDPITARAVVLDDGETPLAIVSCDLLGLSAASVFDIRRDIAHRTSIPAGNILICCTHTHSGPASLPMRGVLRHVDEMWLARTKARIADLVVGLATELQPARMGWGRTTVTGIGVNRQDSSKPHDEEATVISIESASGDTIATIGNYATHPVILGGRYMRYSADYPGVVVNRLEAERGGVGMFIQGASGDVNPVVDQRGLYDDCERLGGILAEGALSVNIDYTESAKLGAASRWVDIPMVPSPSEAELQIIIDRAIADRAAAIESGNKTGELIHAATLSWGLELRERMVGGDVPRSIAVEVSAAAINDLRIVGLPFETYSDIGLGIKNGVKPLQGIFAGQANGLYGYVFPDWAIDQGGYGPANSYQWYTLLTPIGRGAADLLIREGIALAASLGSR